MSKTGKRRRGADRKFRVEVELRQTPDLHKLTQLFLGMAIARAEADKRGEPLPALCDCGCGIGARR
jgi:hypothetical protein